MTLRSDGSAASAGMMVRVTSVFRGKMRLAYRDVRRKVATVTASVADTHQLRWWLLGFGDGVEVREHAVEGDLRGRGQPLQGEQLRVRHRRLAALRRPRLLRPIPEVHERPEGRQLGEGEPRDRDDGGRGEGQLPPRQQALRELRADVEPEGAPVEPEVERPRQHEEQGEGKEASSIEGSEEVAGAVTASTLTSKTDFFIFSLLL